MPKYSLAAIFLLLLLIGQLLYFSPPKNIFDKFPLRDQLFFLAQLDTLCLPLKNKIFFSRIEFLVDRNVYIKGKVVDTTFLSAFKKALTDSSHIVLKRMEKKGKKVFELWLYYQPKNFYNFW